MSCARIIHKREITKALGTADKRQAVERLHAVRVEISRLFRVARLRLTELRVRTEAPAAPEPTPEATIDAIKAWLGETELQALANPAVPHGRSLDEVLADLRGDIAAFSGQHAAEDHSTQSLAREVMASLGYTLNPGSTAFWLAVELAARAGAERGRRAEARMTGDPTMTFDPSFSGVTALSPPARRRAVTFGELVDRYVGNPSRDVSPKTRIADKGSIQCSWTFWAGARHWR